MRIVCISDTHNQHEALDKRLPEGDLLIHAGDLTGLGKRSEIENVIHWFTKVAPRYNYGLIFIAGNHDRCFDPKFNKEDQNQKPTWLLDILLDLQSNFPNIHYLENTSVEVGEGPNKLKIWGSPYSPWFFGDRWAFNAHRGPEIKKYWNMIPVDTDIVVTHTPIAYKLDYVPRTSEYVGCEDLRYKLDLINPKLHISGHIHESYGYEESVFTKFVNAAICDRNYEPSNDPLVASYIDNEFIISS